MELVPVAPDLWVARQPLRFLTLDVGTRMTVVRLPNGDLVIISPIAMDTGDRAAIEALGTVRHIIAPNLFHHLFFGNAQSLWPDATAWGVPGLPEKRPDLRFDNLLENRNSLKDDLQGGLQSLPFRGVAVILPSGIKALNETVFFHRPSNTLILTDIAFNFDRRTSSRYMRWVATLLGSYDTLKPSRLEKWATRDKAAVEASARQVLAWDFDRVIVAHGSIVETGGKPQFKAGYEWFLGRSLP
ncbi:MAG: DUF4336 domain-containing protein [Cyanobacteria bacterium P01_H01_bin.130]